MSSLLPGSRSTVRRLEERVADLEADVAEMRRHNVRLAELVDVVQELLVPVASRDEAKIQEAIARFQESL
ncbi:DUF6752 domain-containing protein [Nocardioides sp. SR21]|uniref:DUF6752 domain-containing protein n=1 Tax=Nocardioides sp. SR21 TaxID=2919501 RepID=UPI001FAA27E5|nr:DUF6752 domain-containing protein [Nocardioides sp. SR21]